MTGLLEIGLVNAATATVLALLAAVASLLCRRPPVVYCLWLLVLVKLITPPLVRLPVEVAGLVADQPAQRMTIQTAGWRREAGGKHLREIAPGAGDHAPLTAPAVNDFRTANESASPSFTHDPNGNDRFGQLDRDYRAGSMPLAGAGAELALDEPKIGSQWSTLPWPLLIGGAWLAGSCCWWLLVAVRIARFSRVLRHSQPASERLQAEASVLSGQLGLSRPPELRVVGGRVPPLLWTLGKRPLVLLPHALLDRLDHQQHVTLLAHELAHLRRRDHWVRWLELVVLGLYWWHPVAWWARRRFQQAEEQCCDAWVLWTLPGLARTYARALLETVEFLSEAQPAMPPAASGLGQVHLLKRRFAMILDDRWPPVLSRRTRLTMLAVGLLGLGISPWPLRVAAEPPADVDPVAVEPASADTQPATENPDLAPTETSVAPKPVPASTTATAEPADTDTPISVSEIEGEITLSKPVTEVQIGSGPARVRRAITLKGPVRTLDPAAEPGSSADDDVHQRLARLEQMVAQLVQEMRTSMNPRRLDYEPGERYGAIRKRTKPEAADSGSVVEEDLFTPDPETRKPKRWQDARVENLMIERNRLRARLEEIERELGESVPARN